MSCEICGYLERFNHKFGAFTGKETHKYIEND